MDKRSSSDRAADREKNWDTIFNTLVTISKNLQKERDFLADRIKYLNGIVYKMKMEQKVEYLKTEFMLGLKEREAFMYKKRYEETDAEFADYRECFGSLSQKTPTSTSDAVSVKRDGRKNKTLQDEVRKLKTEMEKCISEKKSEISALVSEKTFVWNQLKILESNLAQRLREKDDEVKYYNDNVLVLVDRLEELHSTNERLRSDSAKIESESNEKTQEISRLLKEIELLKSRSKSRSPLLCPCRAKKWNIRNNSPKQLFCSKCYSNEETFSPLFDLTGVVRFAEVELASHQKIKDDSMSSEPILSPSSDAIFQGPSLEMERSLPVVKVVITTDEVAGKNDKENPVCAEQKKVLPLCVSLNEVSNNEKSETTGDDDPHQMVDLNEMSTNEGKNKLHMALDPHTQPYIPRLPTICDPSNGIHLIVGISEDFKTSSNLFSETVTNPDSEFINTPSSEGTQQKTTDQAPLQVSEKESQKQELPKKKRSGKKKKSNPVNLRQSCRIKLRDAIQF